MKKDKRGLALITAIAVLALMLILFGGLATVYSAQVSRGKVELEQSQAMLMAQSYAEMLDQVLTSTSGEADDLKAKIGEISTGREVEIKSSLDNQPDNVIDSQVKIIATADKATVSGNTTTRKIKIKVSATVDDETRSIDLDYTFKKVIGGGVMDYAVYGNTVDFYDKENYYKQNKEQYRQEVHFSDDWYYIYNDPKYPSSKEEKLVDDSEIFENNKTFRYGKTDSTESFEKLFKIERDGIIKPQDGDYTNFGLGVNKNDSTATLPEWTSILEPEEGIPVCTRGISTSCIWDNSLEGRVDAKANGEDIIIYMPIEGKKSLDSLAIFFDSETNDDGKRNQLYIYMYAEKDDAKITLGKNLKIANVEKGERSNYLDIFVICNDEIDIEISDTQNTSSVLEAYLYFPKGTVIWNTQINKNNTLNRIRGCLVADRIVILGDESKSFNQVGIEYVPPREIEGSGSSKAMITYKLNSYKEGGKS